MQLRLAGTAKDFESRRRWGVEASLRSLLECSAPRCLLSMAVEPGSELLTVVATATESILDGRCDAAAPAGDSRVAAAARAMQPLPLPMLSRALGVTVEAPPIVWPVRCVEATV
eukprot:scaffold111555_cov33-Phaeocystis_antarctica.AAC.1